MNRVAIIVQARVGSSRLPGKVLKPLHGSMCVLDVLITRLQSVTAIHAPVLAIPHGKTDDKLDDLAENASWDVWRGSEQDVLGRYYDAARMIEADTIVRVTSDCPLVDSNVVHYCLREFHNGQMFGDGCDYLSNCHPTRTMPRGFEVEVFSRAALEWANLSARSVSDREHVTPWLYNNLPASRVKTYTPPDGPVEFPHNLSIDTQEDLDRVAAVVAKLGRLDFTWREAVAAAHELADKESS